MLPEIEILGRIFPSYGILGVLGVLLGLLYTVLRSPRFGLSRDDGAYIYVFGAVGAVLGAKLLYVLLSLGSIIDDLPHIFSSPSLFVQKYILGGMVFYGGAIGAVLAALLAAHAYKQRLSSFFPVLLPAMALAHSVARVGCFMTGCCYGTPSESPISVAFTRSQIAPNNVPLVPVALIEAIGVFFIFVLLCMCAEKIRKRGNLAYIYIFTYAPMRFVLEFYRGDIIRGSLFGLSTSQWISIAAVIAALAVLLISRRRRDAKRKADIE